MPLRKENGFTLVEVLITILLLTFAMLSAATVETNSIQVNSRAARIDGATGLAQLTLENFLRNPNPTALVPGTEAGLRETGDPGGPYTRTWTIDPGPTLNTRRVRVIVTWPGGPGNNRVVLRGLATGGSL